MSYSSAIALRVLLSWYVECTPCRSRGSFHDSGSDWLNICNKRIVLDPIKHNIQLSKLFFTHPHPCAPGSP